MEGRTAYQQPMTVFWSRAQHHDEARRWRAKRRNLFRYNFQVVSKNIILVFELPT